MIQTFRKDRSHFDFLKGLCIVCTFDSGQVFIIPDQQIAQQHHMIGRIHGRIGRITVPKFPNRRSAFINHIAPTWICFVRNDLKRQVLPSVFRQTTHQMLDTQHASTNMAAKIFFGLAYNIIEHFLFKSFGNKPQTQGKNIGRHRIVAILSRLPIEELGIVSLFHFGSTLLVGRNISRLSAQLGKLNHLIQQIIVNCRTQNSTVRLTGRIL